VWLPEDAPLSATNQVAMQAESVIVKVGDTFGKQHPGEDGKPRAVLESITTFVGGGGPRFWFSVSPEQQQLNYAQLVIQTKDKHDTGLLVAPLQRALASIPGARIDVRELETGKPVGIPVAVRVSGDDLAKIRSIGEDVKAILRGVPTAERVRDDWGAESFALKLDVDADRANLAGVSNADVALSSSGSLNGYAVGKLHEADKQIPIVARLRAGERGEVTDLDNLYVYSQRSVQKVPLRQVSNVEYGLVTEKIRRRNHFRTMTISCFATPGTLPSEVMAEAQGKLELLKKSLPPGYRLEIAGEKEEQSKGFAELAIVMAMSIAAIYIALVFQFKSAIKPVIVFAAIPFGIAGALGALLVTGSPFGFMAFLGIASLVGVIVSHIIVLFDFIEEAHAKGEPLREALLDAGIQRLRPVIITVGATVFGLFPLAGHGGPLWEPLCYAQIGGLTVATFITLLLVPVLYAIFVRDLKLVRWHAVRPAGHGHALAHEPAHGYDAKPAKRAPSALSPVRETPGLDPAE
jgi:multidrug efflux pump subunit AcrB